MVENAVKQHSELKNSLQEYAAKNPYMVSEIQRRANLVLQAEGNIGFRESEYSSACSDFKELMASLKAEHDGKLSIVKSERDEIFADIKELEKFLTRSSRKPQKRSRARLNPLNSRRLIMANELEIIHNPDSIPGLSQPLSASKYLHGRFSRRCDMSIVEGGSGQVTCLISGPIDVAGVLYTIKTETILTPVSAGRWYIYLEDGGSTSYLTPTLTDDPAPTTKHSSPVHERR
jgi:hypothetical protein